MVLCESILIGPLDIPPELVFLHYLNLHFVLDVAFMRVLVWIGVYNYRVVLVVLVEQLRNFLDNMTMLVLHRCRSSCRCCNGHHFVHPTMRVEVWLLHCVTQNAAV